MMIVTATFGQSQPRGTPRAQQSRTLPVEVMLFRMLHGLEPLLSHFNVHLVACHVGEATEEESEYNEVEKWKHQAGGGPVAVFQVGR